MRRAVEIPRCALVGSFGSPKGSRSKTFSPVLQRCIKVDGALGRFRCRALVLICHARIIFFLFFRFLLHPRLGAFSERSHVLQSHLLLNVLDSSQRIFSFQNSHSSSCNPSAFSRFFFSLFKVAQSRSFHQQLLPFPSSTILMVLPFTSVPLGKRALFYTFIQHALSALSGFSL